MDLTEEKNKRKKKTYSNRCCGKSPLCSCSRCKYHDTKGGVFTFEKALFYYPSIIGVCADNACRKHFKNTFETFYNIKVDISKRLDSTFKLMPKRWKVERTFSWLCHSRRLSKDYEIKSVYSETMVIISHLHTLLNRF